MLDSKDIPKINRQIFEDDIKQRAMKSLEEKGFHEGQMKAYNYVLSQLELIDWSNEE